MIAEDNIFDLSQPNIELPKNKIIALAKECMVETVVHFKTYLKSGFQLGEKTTHLISGNSTKTITI